MSDMGEYWQEQKAKDQIKRAERSNNNQMSNLSQETIDKIKAEANAAIEVKEWGESIQINSYIKGATEWAGKAQEFIDILETVHSMSYVVGQPGCTFCDTEFDSMSAAAGYNQAVDNMKKVISTALAKYKEVSNGK